MPSKLWIPTIGDKIKLTEDWTFTVKNDYRNSDLTVGGPFSNSFTLPAGTVLKVERVYIRGNFRSYDSVTFRVQQAPDARHLTSKKFGGTSTGSARFFAPLADVNQITGEPYVQA